MAVQADDAEFRRYKLARPIGFVFALALVSCALAGCPGAGDYRKQADDAAMTHIDKAREKALGRKEAFTIETPAQTLRRRLLEGQHLLRTQGPASLGSDQLKPMEYWPKDDYLERDRPEARDPMPIKPDDPMKITLAQALQIGAYNSLDYQSKKEDVFRTALELDLEIDQFRNTYAGLIGSIFGADGTGGTGMDTGLVNTAQAGITRRLESGLSLSSRIMVDLAQMLSSGREGSWGIAADISVTLPLLAGAGEHIVTEPMTQAEREVLYALWDFERYKKTYAVQAASEYLNVLAQLNRVANAEGSYERLIRSVRRAQELAKAGRLSEIQVNQAVQDMLKARDSWISAKMSYDRLLDNFKNTLGLPTDARITLEPAEMARLGEASKQVLGMAPNVDEAEGRDYKVIDAGGDVTVMEPSNEGAGQYELPVEQAMKLAIEHRLDLKTSEQRVTDAQRQVVVTGDALRPGLNLTANASVGDRRDTVSSATESNVRFRPENGYYDVGLEFDFPWEKTAERNAYRNALIDMERAVRSVQDLEDQVKLDVRNALRGLRQSRESFRIQSRAVRVAQNRVDATKMFMDAGRAQIRDVLEAESSLVTAQNALTSALVSYRVSELQLQRDMGVLEVNDQGLWQEYAPPPPEVKTLGVKATPPEALTPKADDGK